MSQISISASQASNVLEKYGYLSCDNTPLEASAQTFETGGHYGIEIPVINSFKMLSATIQALETEEVECTRFNETIGAFLLSDSEIVDMMTLCSEKGYGIFFSVGPRPEYDTKASFYRSQFGLEMGRQLNNNDAFRCAVEEVLRLASLGCRGIIVYDIGLMHLLKRMQQDSLLPANMLFKASTHCMVSNAAIAKVYEEQGFTSLTTAHDLGLPMLSNIRKISPIPLDVPTDVYKSKGGFIRFYEMSEIVQIASPVMLKMGASVQTHPYDNVKEDLAYTRVKRIQAGLEIMRKNLPDTYKLISQKDDQVCLPELGATMALQDAQAVI